MDISFKFSQYSDRLRGFSVRTHWYNWSHYNWETRKTFTLV